MGLVETQSGSSYTHGAILDRHQGKGQLDLTQESSSNALDEMNVHSGGSEAAPSTPGGIGKGCREVAGPLDCFMGVCPMDSTAQNQASRFAIPAEVKEEG